MRMAAAARWTLVAGVVIIIIQILSSVSSVCVPIGSDITVCSMLCPDRKTGYQLYQKCGNEEEKHLLDLRCEDMVPSSSSEQRISYNASSGCCTLTDARMNDLCEYILWLHNSSGSFRKSTDITALATCTPPTSPAAVAPLVVPVAAAVAALVVVILLSVGIFLYCKKRKNMAVSKDVEMKQTNGPSEENGHPPRADQSDPSDVTRKLLDPQNAHETNRSVTSGI